MKRSYKKSIILALFPVVAAGMTGCSDSDHPRERTFEVTVTNLSANQPLSPVGVVYHADGFQAWSIGEEASNGLEVLAEGGDNTQFLSESASDSSNITTDGNNSPFGPGHSATISTTFESNSDIELTVATMLVNTNDAFTGLSGWSIGELEVGEELSRLSPIYDAGTEANTEAEGTIPGPADGGEGFNSEREENGVVTRHPGVVTAGVEGGFDENPLSTLDESHRFDAPIAKIVVRRVN